MTVTIIPLIIIFIQERVRCIEKLEVEDKSKSDQIHKLHDDIAAKDSQINKFRKELEVSDLSKIIADSP